MSCLSKQILCYAILCYAIPWHTMLQPGSVHTLDQSFVHELATHAFHACPSDPYPPPSLFLSYRPFSASKHMPEKVHTAIQSRFRAFQHRFMPSVEDRPTSQSYTYASSLVFLGMRLFSQPRCRPSSVEADWTTHAGQPQHLRSQPPQF